METTYYAISMEWLKGYFMWRFILGAVSSNVEIHDQIHPQSWGGLLVELNKVQLSSLEANPNTATVPSPLQEVLLH